MQHNRSMIGIVAAMPEERVALTRVMQQVSRRRKDGVLLYSGLLQERRICVAEGGMGSVAASRAARLLLTVEQPALLLSAGFCGAVHAGAQVADLVLCKRLFTLDDQGLHEVALPGSDLGCARLSAELQHHGLRTWQGSFITTQRVESKPHIAALLPMGLQTPVLEMESAAVARVAAAAGLPFLGLRSISDAADEELGFSLDELTNDAFQISIPRVLLTCLKRPRIIPQLARLAANSGRAGKNLGKALQQIVGML